MFLMLLYDTMLHSDKIYRIEKKMDFIFDMKLEIENKIFTVKAKV